MALGIGGSILRAFRVGRLARASSALRASSAFAASAVCLVRVGFATSIRCLRVDVAGMKSFAIVALRPRRIRLQVLLVKRLRVGVVARETMCLPDVEQQHRVRNEVVRFLIERDRGVVVLRVLRRETCIDVLVFAVFASPGSTAGRFARLRVHHGGHRSDSRQRTSTLALARPH
ncbi:MAG: hypothetical protein QM736_14570 [Vicinamibacterales bacterium]